MDDASPEVRGPVRPGLRKAAPLIVLGALAASAFAFGVQDYVSFDALREHQESLTSYVAAHPVRSVAIFIVVHAIGVVSMVVPGTVSMTTGGFLFGAVWGTLWLSTGTMIGSTLLFLVARSTLGGWLRRRAGPGVDRLKAGFEKNAFTFMLFLRVVGMTPFAFQNLAPAFFGVRAGPYAVAAFLGGMPWTFVLASIGSGLGDVLASGEDPDLSSVMRPDILLPIFALGAAVLMPTVVRYVRGRRTRDLGGTPA